MERKFRGFVSLVVLVTFVLGILLFVGCAKKKPEIYKIGAILTLTGSASMAGEFQRNGIIVAADEVNEKGGINGKKLEVVYGDSKNEAKEGLTVFKNMVSLEKLPVIIATHSGVAVPLASHVASAKENTVLFVTISSAPGVPEMSENVFRYYVTCENEAKTMAPFAYQKLGVRKVAVFYINDEFGIGGYKAFKETFQQIGGEVTWADSYEKTGIDFRSSLFKMVVSKPEALYVIGYDKPFAIAVKQAREVGFDGYILTSIGMSIPTWLEFAGSAAERIYLTATRFDVDNPVPEIQHFVKRYRKQFGKDPNMMSAFTYDATKLIADTIRQKGYSAEGIRTGLLQTKNFPGAIGSITFGPTGEADMALTVKTVKGGKIVDVER
jgi:branched-chain amino acid transport system substrate-binding protein